MNIVLLNRPKPRNVGLLNTNPQVRLLPRVPLCNANGDHAMASSFSNEMDQPATGVKALGRIRVYGETSDGL